MINPDDEIEKRWKEIEKDDWVNDPRTKGLKRGIFVLGELDRMSDLYMSFESYEWKSIDYSDVDIEEKEPPPPPSKKHQPNFHKGYQPKHNYNKGGYNKRNFNHRRR